MSKPLPARRRYARSGIEWAGVYVRAFPWLVFLGGIVLGIVLVMLSHEVVVYLRQHGF